MELDDREIAIATELAFALLEETFSNLASHLTLDGATPDALRVLDARLESMLERAIKEYERELRPEIGAHALDRVRTIIQRSHSSSELARSAWDR